MFFYEIFRVASASGQWQVEEHPIGCSSLATRHWHSPPRLCRPTVVLTVSLFVIVFTAAFGVPASADEGIGRLHRIDIKAEHPKAYHPAIGDLVQCYLDFPIVPEQIVDDLRPTVEGKSMSVVATVSTSRPRIVGSGQVSLFLAPRQPGLSRVKIEVTVPGQKPKTYEITFLVSSPRP
jgi:hypothetical protein